MTGTDSYSCMCTVEFEGANCEKRNRTCDIMAVVNFSLLSLAFYQHKLKTLILSANCSTGLSCPPGKKTHDPQGRCCVFPFTYGGVSYNSCTTVANGNKPWCSFDSVYAGKWANCGKENIVCKEDSYMLISTSVPNGKKNPVVLI